MKKVKIIILTVILSIFFQNLQSKEIKVFEFSEEEMKNLKIRKIKKETTYTLGSNENGNFLKAEAEGTASGLGVEKKINLVETPFINITWYVEKDLAGIDENTKKTHDYAARVFVIKKTGSTALSNRVINYVYSSNNPIGHYKASPYTKKSIDYSLSTTKKNIKEWVTVKSNVKEDFKKLHNLDVEEISGVAVMTDTDNSKLKAIAYYQNIYFSAE
jgi:hypothetical protein